MFDNPLSLDELASVAHFSPYHFHRVFRGMVGETVAEHVRRLRLERAARHLIYTRRSVTDLAFDAGYETMESFIRAFRKRFGYAPSCYRQIRSAGRGRTSADDSDQPFIAQNFTFKKGGLAVNDVNIVKLESARWLLSDIQARIMNAAQHGKSSVHGQRQKGCSARIRSFSACVTTIRR